MWSVIFCDIGNKIGKIGSCFHKSRQVWIHLYLFINSFICSLWPVNIITLFLMFRFALLFMLTISVSTVSLPKFGLEGEHKVYVSSTNKTHPSAFLMIFVIFLVVPPLYSAMGSIRCIFTTFSLLLILISLNILLLTLNPFSTEC